MVKSKTKLGSPNYVFLTLLNCIGGTWINYNRRKQWIVSSYMNNGINLQQCPNELLDLDENIGCPKFELYKDSSTEDSYEKYRLLVGLHFARDFMRIGATGRFQNVSDKSNR